MSRQSKSKNSSTIAGKVAFAIVTEAFDGKKISGVLAIPRISTNGNLYLPEELERGNGKVLPLFMDHLWKKSRDPIGQMALAYDPKKQHLTFDAIVTDPEAANQISADSSKYGASLGATFSSFDRVCGEKACYKVLHGLNFLEGSITKVPAMPETKGMLTVTESVELSEDKEEHNCKCNSKFEDDGVQVPTGGPAEDDGIGLTEDEDDGENQEPKGGGPAATPEKNAAEGIPKDKKDEFTKPNGKNEDDKVEAGKQDSQEDDKIEVKHENDGIDGIPTKIDGEDDGIKTNDKHPEDIPEDDPDRKEVKVNDKDEDDKEMNRAFSTVEGKIGTISEKGDGALYVRGILAVPRVNLNNSLLLPQELAKGHGLTIPMSVDHAYTYDQSAENKVGTMAMFWNDQSMRLEFEGVITNGSVASAVRAGKYKSVSISISVGDFDKIYGFYVLRDIGFIEGSLTDNPAIPEATNTVIESVNKEIAGKKFADAKELAKFVTNSLSINSKHSTVSMPESNSNDLGKFANVVTESINKLTSIAEEQKKAIAELSKKAPMARVGDAAPEKKDVAAVQSQLKQLAMQARANVLRQTKELNDSLVKQEFDRLISASNIVTETGIDTSTIGTALGQYWTVDITTVPDYILANLRDTCDQKIIGSGQNAGTIHWTLMARPTWSTSSVTPPVTSPTAYNTSTYPITDVSKQAVTYYVFQYISDNVVAQATPDFMNKMQQLFVEGASILLDKLVITELDGATPAATLYGDESVTAEANITASMVFSPTRIINGLKNLEAKGFFPQSQEAVCVMHPYQMASILQSALIQNQLYYGTTPNSAVKIPILYGVELRITNYVATGTGSPTTVTTYHAYLYMKQVCIGLGMTQDVRLEIGRVTGEMATRVVGSVVAAAKLKTGNALVIIITA